MSVFDVFWSVFAGPSVSQSLAEIEIKRLRKENRILALSNLELCESVGDLRAEAERHSEAAAAARLRLADLQRKTTEEADIGAATHDELRKDLEERLSATLEALDKARDEARKSAENAKEARRIAGLALKQMETYQDSVKMLVGRGAISAIEVAQLNLGTYIPGDKQSGLAPTVEFGTVVEGKASIDFGMKSQATEAKYRILKGHFQAYQAAISIMLDRMNDLSKSNHVTKEDLRKLRGLREELSIQIKRTI